MILIILLIGFILPSSVSAIGLQGNLLLFTPPVIAATHFPENSLVPENPLISIGGSAVGCQDGQMTDGWLLNELKNSHSQRIKIVEMKIIDPSWQFAEPNSLPIILAPESTFTYAISHINGYLCENPPEHTKRVMFVFSDGSSQKV